MSAATLLDALTARGVRLEVRGRDLQVIPPPTADRAALRELIGRHKTDLLVQLHHDAMLLEPWDAPKWIDVDKLLTAIDHSRHSVPVLHVRSGGRR